MTTFGLRYEWYGRYTTKWGGANPGGNRRLREMRRYRQCPILRFNYRFIYDPTRFVMDPCLPEAATLSPMVSLNNHIGELHLADVYVFNSTKYQLADGFSTSVPISWVFSE
jgi:hypothetical protein